MPGSHYQVPSSKFHHSTYSLTDSSENGPEDEEADGSPRLTPLQKLTTSMCKDENTIKELIIGRRVGFYKVRGEIGCGTFSRVKLAFHALTKGRRTFQTTQQYPGRGWAVMSANNIGKKKWMMCTPLFVEFSISLKLRPEPRADPTLLNPTDIVTFESRG